MKNKCHRISSTTQTTRRILQNCPALTWSKRGTDAAAAATVVTAFVFVYIAAADQLLVGVGQMAIQGSGCYVYQEGDDVESLQAHDHGGDEDNRQRHAGDEERYVGCAEAEEIGAEDGDDPGLDRVDRGGREDRHDDEGEHVPADEIKECQVGKLFEVVVGSRIVGVRQHPHDPKEQGRRGRTLWRTPPRVPVGPGGPDTLPRALVEHLGAGDGDEHYQPVGGPVRCLCELLPGEPIGWIRARHDE